MRIEVRENTREVGRFVQNVFDRQVPFATAQALNDSARDGQAVQRMWQRQLFDVKREGFIDRSVKHKPRATKRRQWTKVLIDPPGGEARADITGKFETETRKRPISGLTVAIPTEHVPRTATGIIKRAWRPSRLKRRRRVAGGQRRSDRSRAAVGQTFRKDNTIWLRTADGGIVPLYYLKPSVPISPDLRFQENVGREAARRYPAHFTRRFDGAIRTAR